MRSLYKNIFILKCFIIKIIEFHYFKAVSLLKYHIQLIVYQKYHIVPKFINLLTYTRFSKQTPTRNIMYNQKEL